MKKLYISLILVGVICFLNTGCISRPDNESEKDISQSHAAFEESAEDKIIHNMESPLLKEDISEGTENEVIANGEQAKDFKPIEGGLKLSGLVRINGSGMMAVISEKIAEKLRNAYPDMKIKIESSSSEEGLKALAEGKCDICNSTRAIKPDEKKLIEDKLGGTLKEIIVAYDGIVFAVNKGNTWASVITLEDIKRIWEPESQILLWSDLNEKYPCEEIVPYGPPISSGIMNFIRCNILGVTDEHLADYVEIDNFRKLVGCIAEDKFSIGIMSYSTYAANKEKVKALRLKAAEDSSDGSVEPSVESIKSGKYKALSCPLYLYVMESSLRKQEISEYIRQYLNGISTIALNSGYIPLQEGEYENQLRILFK